MDDNLVFTHGISNDLSLDVWILVSDLTVESVFCRFGANGTDRSMNSDRYILFSAVSFNMDDCIVSGLQPPFGLTPHPLRDEKLYICSFFM